MASGSRSRRFSRSAAAPDRRRWRQCAPRSRRSRGQPGLWRHGRTPSAGFEFFVLLSLPLCLLLSLLILLLVFCSRSYRAIRAGPLVGGAPPRSYVLCGCIADRRAARDGRLARPVRPCLLDDVGDDPRADGAATLADGEPQAWIHGDRLDQLDRHLDVVSRHHHLRPLGEVGDPGHVGGAEVELGPVAGEERRMTTALLLLQAVDLSFELGVRRDRARLAEHLATLDLLALGTAQEGADVVAGLTLV